MDHRRPGLTELALRRWARDLRQREQALADREAAFERRVETLVDTRASDVAAACEVVNAAFPAGIAPPLAGRVRCSLSRSVDLPAC
jgi:hypothetical protein